MTDDQILSVVSAHKEGKKIQCRKPDGDWFEAFPFWDFTTYIYRVAPEPRKPREWILHIPDEIIVENKVGEASIYPANSEGHNFGWIAGSQCIRVREVLE